MKKILFSFFFSTLMYVSFGQVCFSTGKRITHFENGSSWKVISFDVDGDNDIDIVSIDDNTIYWHENNGNNIFELKHEISFSSSIEILAASNNNFADTHIDLFVREFTIGSDLFNLINDGTGQFTAVSASVESHGASFANKDITGDNFVEVAVVDQMNNDDGDGISLWELSATGEFENERYFNFPNMIFDNVYYEDMNKDNSNDLIIPVISLIPSNYYILLKANDGSGNFADQDTLVTESENISKISFADIDGDTFKDLVCFLDSKIVWYKNKGSGDFETQALIHDFGNNNFFLCAIPVDVDNDEDIDIISNTENNVVWYENTDGEGTFGEENILFSKTLIRSVYIDDIDKDNDFDVLVASSEGTFWFENNPQVSIIKEPDNTIVTEGSIATISVEAEGSELTYQWQFNQVNLNNEGNISGVYINTLTIDPVSQFDAGNYRCLISGTCHNLSSIEISFSVNSSEINDIDNKIFKIYPNPTKGFIYLLFKDSRSTEISVTDETGKLILLDKADESNAMILDLSQFKKGLYFINLKIGNTTYTEKIILN